MKTLNITKGEAHVGYSTVRPEIEVNVRTGERTYKVVFKAELPATYMGKTTDQQAYDEVVANAHLIADAFNTANKTGLLPSELAEQNEKLKHIIEQAAAYITPPSSMLNDAYDELKKAQDL